MLKSFRIVPVTITVFLIKKLPPLIYCYHLYQLEHFAFRLIKYEALTIRKTKRSI